MAQYEVTLRDYWRILRRRTGIVLFTVFLLGSFSFAIANLWKNRSTARLFYTSSKNWHCPSTVPSTLALLRCCLSMG